MTTLFNATVAGDEGMHVAEGPRMRACGPEGDFRELLTRGAQVAATAATVDAPSSVADARDEWQLPKQGQGAGAASVAAAAASQQPAHIAAVPDGTTVVWVATPAAGFFQHYLQNVLPKIAMASLFHPEIIPPPPQPLPADAIIAAPRKSAQGDASSVSRSPREDTPTRPSPAASVLAIQELLPARFALVPSLYSQFGWTVRDDRRNALQVRGARSSVVYPCVAPPLHPFLWQTAQAAVLGVRALPLERRSRIIYCGRTGVGRTENTGRRVLNEHELLPALRSAAEARGLTLEVFDSSAFAGADAQTLLDYWSTARVIIGPHGGALSNLVFAGCGTTVIELFPLAFGIKPPVGHAGMMMYMQSTFLEQDYWMLPCMSMQANGDFDAPISDVTGIINEALPLP